MISTTLVTCVLCRSYYADPRQIACSHSFCFDCITGRFDDQTMMLICPKCKKLHQYHSRADFEHRCIPDGFLASMVTQFKKKHSRSAAISSGMISRPSSSLSMVSSSSMLHPSRPSSVLSQSNPRVLVAKCQLCNLRAELAVCKHCDNVICLQCTQTHQKIVYHDIQRTWETCQIQLNTTYQRSARFDSDHEECENRTRQFQRMICQRGDKLIQIVDQQKNSYLDLIEKHRLADHWLVAQEQVKREYTSIDQRLSDFLRFNDVTGDKIVDVQSEIEHFENRLNNFSQLLDANELKFPILTLPEPLDAFSFFGAIDFTPLNPNSSTQLTSADAYVQIPFGQMNTVNRIPLPSSLSHIPRKKLLWQFDYKSVPYFIRAFANRLFVCDKYGYLAIYELSQVNNLRDKPNFLHDIKLFHELVDDPTIIDTFNVHPCWIIVSKRNKPDSSGSIHLFTHDGYSIPHGQYLHNHPSKEFTMDIETNLLWSLDEQQLGLFYSPLPTQRSVSPAFADYFQNRFLYMQFSKPLVPNTISVTKDHLAILDKHRQAIHVYNKRTGDKLYEYVNHPSNTTHICWQMALFSDHRLLIKLDEISTLRLGPSKHLYLHLDVSNRSDVLSMIEEVDTYGMMLAPTNEILLGVKKLSQGTVKCYV